MNSGMHWTTSAEIKQQVRKLWDSGKILSSMAAGKALFPRRLVLKGPDSRDLSNEFAAVRDWITALRQDEAHGYRIVWRDMKNRVIGQNRIPYELWVDSLENALAMIGKCADASRFSTLLAETSTCQPGLIPWLIRYPHKTLEFAEAWPRLLDIVGWLHARPRPGIYLRQVDLPGIHSKFIEMHRGVLAELLDIVLPPESIQKDATGVTGFCRRYGFRDKPIRVRFRVLDPNIAILPGGGDQDFKVTQNVFARLAIPLRRVFITENEINFLAFPPVQEGAVIFGAGYGFEMFNDVRWLHGCFVHYWGDLDTHGFAMLDQLRTRIPHAESFLMDRKTLLDHRQHWGKEPQQENRELPRLTSIEAELYDDLRCNRISQQLRLEQEKVGFACVEHALARLRSDA